MVKRKKNDRKTLFYVIAIGIALVLALFSINSSRFTFFGKAAPYIPPPMPLKTDVNLGFMGELNIGRYINKNAFDTNSYDLFDTKMESYLNLNYLNVANLESDIIGKNENGILQCPIKGSGSLMIFCGSPEFVPEFSRNNFIFTLANNHIDDFSSINGRTRTMEELDKYNVPYYYSHDLKTEFVKKQKNNIAFGFIGVDFANRYSFNQKDFNKVIDLIKKYDRQVDWLVLSIHWGQEYSSKPSKAQIEYAHAFIDAGADIIHGHHVHVLQPYEMYKGKLIFYSLGNFVFDQDFREDTRTSAFYSVNFTKSRINKITEYKINIPKSGKSWVTSSSVIYTYNLDPNKKKVF